MEEPLYDLRIYYCVNSRDAGHPQGDCSRRGAQDLQNHLVERLKQLPESCRVRVSSSGCLNRCQSGPALVIYPQGVWYRYRSQADINEIVQRHLLGGEQVQRLLISAADPTPGGKDPPRQKPSVGGGRRNRGYNKDRLA
ncbi:MAG: (2Fe-2S) ferredoxin domain-containing protein [Magnetococcus sp. MYC-9]